MKQAKDYLNLLGSNQFPKLKDLKASQINTLSQTYFNEINVGFENSSMPFSAYPFIISDFKYQQMSKQFAKLNLLLERTVQIYRSEKQVRNFFRFPEQIQALLELNNKGPVEINVGRFDFVIDSDDSLKVYEFNTDCPAGMSFSHIFSLVFQKTQIPEALDLTLTSPQVAQRGFFVQRVQDHFSNRLKGVGILNSRKNTLFNELKLLKRDFQSLGIPCEIGFIEDLQYSGQELTLNGLPINICYNKFDTFIDSTPPFGRSELEIASYCNAIRDGNLSLINSIEGMFITESKLSLAVLSSPEFASFFTEAERSLIEQLIPWTRLISQLADSDLEKIVMEKDHYVIKKGLDTRGRSVLIGRNTPIEQWIAAIKSAQKSNDKYVIQKFHSPMACRNINDPDLPETFFTTLAGLIIFGELSGVLVRSSSDLVTNVARSGFVQPFAIRGDPS